MATKHYSKLEDEMVNYVVPTMIEAMMSGVQHAKQAKDGTVTLEYSDKTQQTKKITADICKEVEGFFNIVTLVQN